MALTMLLCLKEIVSCYYWLLGEANVNSQAFPVPMNIILSLDYPKKPPKVALAPICYGKQLLPRDYLIGQELKIPYLISWGSIYGRRYTLVRLIIILIGWDDGLD